MALNDRWKACGWWPTKFPKAASPAIIRNVIHSFRYGIMPRRAKFLPPNLSRSESGLIQAATRESRRRDSAGALRTSACDKSNIQLDQESALLVFDAKRRARTGLATGYADMHLVPLSQCQRRRS